MDNLWKKRLFVAICRKYGVSTYRYKGQKYTTTMLRVSKEIVEECLWPEFQKYAKMLEDLVEEVLDSVISKIHQVDEEEIVISGEIGSP